MFFVICYFLCILFSITLKKNKKVNVTFCSFFIFLKKYFLIFFICFPYFFLVFLSLDVLHASIKKLVKILDYCDFPLQNVYRNI